MTFTTLVVHLAALAVMPLFLFGTIVRVKSLWSGRKGPPLFQLAFDLRRLLRKSPVYSHTATPLFRIAPWVFLVTALASALFVPLTGVPALVSFPFDFVWFAYVWGLGRVMIMLAALDTGSPFEGMGAAREATFATMLEPAIFLVVGALCLLGGTHTLAGALSIHFEPGAAMVVGAAAIVALLVVLQVETARMPVDDPTTHLELTMVHEVMILDHSGPDLAAIQLASALKLYVGASLLATLMNPIPAPDNAAAAALGVAVHLAICVAVAIVVGTIESLIARLKLRTVPQYIVVALAAGVVALLGTLLRQGATP